MKLRWVWHICGALGAIYFLLFWACIFTPLGNKLPVDGGHQVLLANFVALVLSLLAATRASKGWYSATVILVLKLLFVMYVNGA